MCDIMYLSTLTIILILTRETLAFEPIKDLSYRFGRFCQHRFQRNTRL